MAARAEKRTGKRTKQQIAADLAAILSIASLHDDTRRGIIWKMIWDFTEVKGKWNADFAWSEEAAKHKAKTGKNTGLVREHSYPMSLSIADLLAIKEPSGTILLPLLENAARICVLTTEEDKALNKEYKSGLPGGCSPDDVFGRYRAVGIAIVGVEKVT